MRLKNDKPVNLNARNARKLIPSFRVNEAEQTQLQDLADQYTGGDISKWCRYASLHFRPTKKDVEDAPAT